MAFAVIHMAPGLSPSQRQQAATAGPDFVATDRPYAAMLGEAGFARVEHHDVSAEFRRVAVRWLHHARYLDSELRAALGDAIVDRRVEHLRAAIEAVDAGLLQRSLFVVRES
jgi:hypothetical protein